MTERDLSTLLEKAKTISMTPEEKEGQRRSFAYGNANIENSAVTRKVIDEAAAELESETDQKA